MCKVRILFFAADPEGADRLRLGADMQAIQKRVQSAKYGDALEFHWRLAACPEDLQQALKEIRPHVVHFSGHGQEDGIYLIGPDGGPHLVEAEALTRLFQLFPGKIRLVVLNACLSFSQAKAIAGVVGCAIGTRGKISDEAAITFGAAFYEAIAGEKSVQRAFDEAVNLLQMKHPADKDYPGLIPKPGVNPRRLVLMRRRLCRIGKAAVGLALVGAATVAVKKRVEQPQGALPNCGWGMGAPPHTLVDGSTAPVAASVNGVDSDLATAKALYRGGHCAAAFPLFKHAAEAGVPEAMGFLGIAYLKGQGTKADSSLAMVWLHKAAAKRDPRGMTALGSAYQNGEGVNRSLYLAKHWYLAAVNEKRWVEAMRSLGTLYRDERSYDSALVWCDRAVRAGSRDAWVDEGLIYESDRSGVVRDLGRARRLYRAAADAGLPRGMFAMGRVHQEGIGVPQDYALARAWYSKAASLGSPEAMNALGDLYLHGFGVPKDQAKAIRWYRRARDAGSRIAADELDSLKANRSSHLRLTACVRQSRKHAAPLQHRSGAAVLCGSRTPRRATAPSPCPA
jgi:TPR repeat protein